MPTCVHAESREGQCLPLLSSHLMALRQHLAPSLGQTTFQIYLSILPIVRVYKHKQLLEIQTQILILEKQILLPTDPYTQPLYSFQMMKCKWTINIYNKHSSSCYPRNVVQNVTEFPSYLHQNISPQDRNVDSAVNTREFYTPQVVMRPSLATMEISKEQFQK